MKRFAMTVALLFVATLQMGCSTPPVPESGTFQEAWSAYEDCHNRLAPSGREYQCDQVSSTNLSSTSSRSGLSYNDYSRYQTDSYESYSSSNYRYPYFSYLASAEPEVLSDLTDQWLELADTTGAEYVEESEFE